MLATLLSTLGHRSAALAKAADSLSSRLVICKFPCHVGIILRIELSQPAQHRSNQGCE